MNNKLIIAIVAIGMSTFACKKERTCECKTTSTSSSTDVNGVTTSYTSDPTTSTTKYTKAKKSELRVSCGNSKYESNYTSTDNGNPDGGGGYKSETTCELK